MKEYDYLIVGAGLYGAVMAHELKKKGILQGLQQGGKGQGRQGRQKV